MIPTSLAKSISLSSSVCAIDHIAIAVTNLESSLEWFTTVLGFSLKERRRTEGTTTAMISAVIELGPVQVVLLEGTSPESQVSRFIQHYGPGVQHIAIRVNDLSHIVEQFKQRGLQFDTTIIEGGGLRQIFTKRDIGSGLMIELIERAQNGFAAQNVTDLFAQLEKKNSF